MHVLTLPSSSPGSSGRLSKGTNSDSVEATLPLRPGAFGLQQSLLDCITDVNKAAIFSRGNNSFRTMYVWLSKMNCLRLELCERGGGGYGAQKSYFRPEGAESCFPRTCQISLKWGSCPESLKITWASEVPISNLFCHPFFEITWRCWSSYNRSLISTYEPNDTPVNFSRNSWSIIWIIPGNLTWENIQPSLPASSSDACSTYICTPCTLLIAVTLNSAPRRNYQVCWWVEKTTEGQLVAAWKRLVVDEASYH